MTIKHSYYEPSSPIDQQYILSSNYTSQHASDESDRQLRSRQPLTNLAGNSRLHILAGLSTYNDSKLRSHRYAVQNLPFQPPRGSRHAHRTARNAAQLRRDDIRQIKNPIVDQPHYSAYRQRQAQEGKQAERKWPDVLEEAFLDALDDVPNNMGRRKFFYKGKPHGRNEMIQEYIWLAYCQSLPPGQVPNQLMRRKRKQVSSHIQVLKHFLKGTPDLERLFPKKSKPKNGFEDNFKDNPTLRALSEGRLPAHRLYKYKSVSQKNPMRPALFWIKMTSDHVPSEYGARYKDTDMYSAGPLAHKYTILTDQGLRTSLDSIDDWRSRFPYLADLHAMKELECDIIHMNVALELTAAHAPEGSDLIGRITMSIPGRELSDCAWQSVTTLCRPPELLRDPSVDPALEAVAVSTEVLAVSDTETQLKVPFPANAWAQTFTSLTNIQLALEERKHLASYKLHSDLHVPSVRHFIEQVTMYQELESRSGPSVPFIKRAILLWTFRKARIGEAGTTTWRYLDPPPHRDAVMSPPVPSMHHELADMHENFHTWRATPAHSHTKLLDPFVYDLGTPTTHSHSAGLQPPFQHMSTAAYGYQTTSFPLSTEGMSFLTESRTLDGESTTLVDTESQNRGRDHYLTSANKHDGLEYGDEHTGWHIDGSVTNETFDSDGWAEYSGAPAPTPMMGWESEEQARDGGSGDGMWQDVQETANGGVYHQGQEQEDESDDEHEDEHEIWMETGTQLTQHGWDNSTHDQYPMVKQSQSFIERHFDIDMLDGRTPIKSAHAFTEQTLDHHTHPHPHPHPHPHSPIKHSDSFIEQQILPCGTNTNTSSQTPIKDSHSFTNQQDFDSVALTTPSLLKHSASFLEGHVESILPTASSPNRQPHLSIEQTLEQKLAPCVHQSPSPTISKGFEEVIEQELASMPDIAHEMGEHKGVESQDFEDLDVNPAGNDGDVEADGIFNVNDEASMIKEQEWVFVEPDLGYEELAV